MGRVGREDRAGREVIGRQGGEGSARKETVGRQGGEGSAGRVGREDNSSAVTSGGLAVCRLAILQSWCTMVAALITHCVVHRPESSALGKTAPGGSVSV